MVLLPLESRKELSIVFFLSEAAGFKDIMLRCLAFCWVSGCFRKLRLWEFFRVGVLGFLFDGELEPSLRLWGDTFETLEKIVSFELFKSGFSLIFVLKRGAFEEKLDLLLEEFSLLLSLSESSRNADPDSIYFSFSFSKIASYASKKSSNSRLFIIKFTPWIRRARFLKGLNFLEIKRRLKGERFWVGE